MYIQRRRLKGQESKSEDGVMVKDEKVSSLKAKQQFLQRTDTEAVTMDTAVSMEIAPSLDVGVKNDDRYDDDDDDDDESDEVEEGELVSSSASESELEPEETVPEKGNI